GWPERVGPHESRSPILGRARYRKPRSYRLPNRRRGCTANRVEESRLSRSVRSTSLIHATVWHAVRRSAVLVAAYVRGRPARPVRPAFDRLERSINPNARGSLYSSLVPQDPPL